jgi:branched-chain amino acid transport system substrate-binding protein
MPFRLSAPLFVVLAFVALGVGLGGKENTGTPDLIKVVSSLPRSGSARGQTDTIVNGIRLALLVGGLGVEGVGPDGKPFRFRLQYLDLDDATAAAGQWTIEQEIANANQARTDPDVMAYIGTYNSGAAKVSMPILNRAGLFMVSPANTAESLTKPRTGERHEPSCYRPTGVVNYTRVVPTDDLQSELSARWIRDLLKDSPTKAVYILDDNQTYGQGIATSVNKFCKQLGLTVLGQESIDDRSQEFSALMTKISRLKPDLIYFGGTSQSKAGQLLNDLRKAGMRCPMMGPDGCYEQAMVDSVGLDVFEEVKFYATFGGLPIEALREGAGRGAAFYRAYDKEYGGPPKEAYSAYGYECGLVVLEAIRKAGVKDREAIRKAALEKIKDFPGATGVFSFDANGDTTNQAMSGNVVEVVFDKELGKKVGRFKFVQSLKK